MKYKDIFFYKTDITPVTKKVKKNRILVYNILNSIAEKTSLPTYNLKYKYNYNMYSLKELSIDLTFDFLDANIHFKGLVTAWNVVLIVVSIVDIVKHNIVYHNCLNYDANKETIDIDKFIDNCVYNIKKIRGIN